MLLQNTAHHISDTSIPKTDVTPEKEPALREKLSELARQIVANPSKLLLDEYDEVERMKDWKGLVKKQVVETGDILPIDARSRPGHKFLDHYMPHFYDVKNYKGKSVKGQMTQEAVEKALLANLCMHSTPYKSEIRRMITMTSGLGNVTKYRTVTAKAIVEFFHAKRVLDPCVGWGGRMLGSLSADSDVVYVGCEPDPNTAKGLRGMLEDPAIPEAVRRRGTILEQPIEVALPALQAMEKFDCVLTSPPYFNLELYTAGQQSTNEYWSWDDWTSKWLKPVILGCLMCLKPTGVSCWSVKNFKTDKLYPLADFVKKVHIEAGWILVKTVTMSGSARPGAKRIEDGKETRESEEETFCFKRKDSA
jgi:hypothetical protein